MGGIAGCYQQVDGQKLVDIMTESIAHRGPDASGLWANEDDRAAVHLGHRRLSIIDLSSAADQPLSKDGLTVVYDGELYNYKALRAQLATRGVRFVTESDTEVLIEAWRCWGPAALTRFRGMFAFALHDMKTGEVFLARDPLGIKPLYYSRRGGGVLFASELKALVAAAGSELRIEPGALVASMLYCWLPDQRCAIDGVRKLPAGTWARCSPDGALNEQPYWSVAEVAAEAVDGLPADLCQVVEDAVSAHLVADVPVSTFLSGGLDSSIVAVLSHQADAAIEAYTITFRQQEQRLEAVPDYAAYARTVASRHGMRLHQIEISPDIVSMLPRLVDVFDEPIGDPAAINTLLMCEAARERGVKVALSGIGADELFGGSRKHLTCALASRYHKLPAPWAKRFMTLADLPEEPRFRRSYTLYGPDELIDLVSPDLADHVGRIVDEHAAIYNDNSLPGDMVNRMCLADARLSLPGLKLAYTDRASMATSVEVRVPFVDPLVAAAAFSFSGQAKISRGKGKIALKRAAEKWLPAEVLQRPKASFSAPLRAWVKYDLHEVIQDVLVAGELVSCGMIRRGALTRLVADEQAGMHDRSKQIWQLLTLELWYRHALSKGVAA